MIVRRPKKPEPVQYSELEKATYRIPLLEAHIGQLRRYITQRPDTTEARKLLQGHQQELHRLRQVVAKAGA